MYNKKYYLEDIKELNNHNPIYDDMVGETCYLAYLKVGERGWFLYEDNDWLGCHRVHTSVIKNVEYSSFIDDTGYCCERIIVETQNTKFTFRLTVECEIDE